MVTSPLWAEFQRQEAAKQTRPQAFGDAAAAYSNPGTKQVATSPLIRAAATAPKPPTVPLMQFAQSQQAQQSPAAPTNLVPLMQAAGIQPFSSQSDVRRVDNAISAASAPSSTVSSTSAPRSLIDAAREVAPGVYNHGRGQYSDNPKGMGLIAAAGLGGAQTTPGPAQRMGLVEMARQQSTPGSTAWSSADNATMAANLRDGVDLYRGTPQDTQNQPYTPPQDTGGYGLLDKNARDLRNARVQAEQFKPGARQSIIELMRQQEAEKQRDFQQRESLLDYARRQDELAAQRRDAAEGRAIQREGLAADVANNQARLGLEERRANLAENDPALAVARQVLALRDRVLNAKNPQERAQAAQDLATVEGRNQPANGGKPLPAAALRMQQDDLDAVGLASTISADLGAIQQQITDGKLKFGVIRNAWNKSKNAIGRSDEESRALGSFMSTLEKMRNDSLRLNKGVQTEGDAQRAWNEMFQNLGDENFVKQRLAEIQAINERAASLRGNSIQTLRENYGASPLDLSAFTSVRPVVGQQGQQPVQQRTVTRTGTMNGRRVVQYSDGSISYAD